MILQRTCQRFTLRKASKTFKKPIGIFKALIGLRRITVHALHPMIATFLNVLATLRLNRLEKVRSITFLAK
jgi:hypothetical protein